MLTIEEILADVAISPGFTDVREIGVHSRGRDGQTPLHWMATLGDVVGIRLLLDAGAAIDAMDTNGNTPLHEAVSCRHAPAAQLLFARGANACIPNKTGLNAVQMAAADGYESTIAIFRRSERAGENGEKVPGSK